jgi:site-specific DNA-methyltransferase (adenine-specific)
MSINFYNIDCMDLMKDKPDKFWDLAIVDVPYTDNYDSMTQISISNKGKIGNYHYNSLVNKKPKPEYYIELKRVSKNQIVWGANYLIEYLKSTPCVIVWDKNNTGNFADCEIAFGSFDLGAKIFKYTWNGMLQGDMKNKQDRIHPTEKPIQLYEWLLMNYAKLGDKILDTHGGSMSIAIACHNLGFDLDCCELDEEYFVKAKARFEKHKLRPKSFFKPEEEYKPMQTKKLL